MAIQYTTRRRLALAILVIGLPVYIGLVWWGISLGIWGICNCRGGMGHTLKGHFQRRGQTAPTRRNKSGQR